MHLLVACTCRKKTLLSISPICSINIVIYCIEPHCKSYNSFNEHRGTTKTDKTNNKPEVLCHISLIDWLSTVLRPVQEYFVHMGKSLLPMKFYKMDAFARRFPPLSSFIVPYLHGLIRSIEPFSRPLRHYRELTGTRINTAQWYLQEWKFPKKAEYLVWNTNKGF